MALYLKEQPPESWENWPTAGGMRNGSLFQRPTWAPATAGQGGSAGLGENWPTPQVGTGENSHGQISGDFRNRMEELLAGPMWATPDCNTSTYSNGMKGPNIRQQAMQWATPRAGDGEKGGPNQAGSKGDLMLPSMAAQWPTPSASVANDGESPQTWHARAAQLKEKHGNGNGAGLPLTVAAVQWPTPAARDYKGTNSAQHMNRTDGRTDGRSRNHADQLPNFIMMNFSHPDQQTPDGQQSSSTSPTSPRHLNPIFGELLMGWPLQWTKAEPSASSASATELYRSALQQRLSSLFGEQQEQ